MDIFAKYSKLAKELDEQDPLKKFKAKFAYPKNHIYLCTNSLGLPAASSSSKMQSLLQKWSQEGAEGWFYGEDNWCVSLDADLKRPLSKLLGASTDEVAVMNTLTVNLHLLMVSFYQPTKSRYKILIDGPSFPSDLYAMKSHLSNHGINPDDGLIIVEPRKGEHRLRTEDIVQIIEQKGESIALVFLNNVNFLTGQVIDLSAITKAAKKKGCVVGYDIAHAAGNIPLSLHNDGVDFAVGCSYKYLCSGPGGPGIAFVHSSHHTTQFPRLSGWWGNDPKLRFQMHLEKDFVPYGGASSWAVSTPSIVALMPLLASLEIFEEAGIAAIRKKSELQTDFLLQMLDEMRTDDIEVVTSREPQNRGCQLSLKVNSNAKELKQKLYDEGIICDLRQPNIIRITPSPLYNSFFDLHAFTIKLRNSV